jgi:hypothetical protein
MRQVSLPVKTLLSIMEIMFTHRTEHRRHTFAEAAHIKLNVRNQIVKPVRKSVRELQFKYNRIGKNRNGMSELDWSIVLK